MIVCSFIHLIGPVRLDKRYHFQTVTRIQEQTALVVSCLQYPNENQPLQRDMTVEICIA